MNLSEPKQITFWIAMVLAVVGIIASLVTIPVLSGFAFWLVVLGFIVLAAGNLMQGLQQEGGGTCPGLHAGSAAGTACTPFERFRPHWGNIRLQVTSGYCCGSRMDWMHSYARS